MTDLYPVVERATNAPAKCAVSADIDGPFVDLGCWLPAIDPYLYLHVPVAEKVGRSVGMVPKAEVDKLKAQLDELSAKLEEFETLAKAIADVERAEKVLEEAGV